MKSRSAFFVTMVSLLFAACKTLQPEAPIEEYKSVPIKPVTSDIPIKVNIDLQKIEGSLNKSFQGLLFQGQKVNDMDLDVKVWKASDIHFTVDGNNIDYKVPLKVWVKYTLGIDKFGITINKDFEADGTLDLNYRSSFNIDNNWKLVTKTVSTGFNWTREPQLKVAGIQLPIKTVASFALNRSNEMISAQIDNSISTYFNLRSYVNDAWNMLQKPTLIYPDNNTWIKITPIEISTSPLIAKKNQMEVNLLFKGQFETVVGEKPANTSLVKLPSYKINTMKGAPFNINLAADLTYKEINKIARENLIDKTFADGKRNITIKDMKLYGSNNKMICMLDVIGSIKGKIYFTGDLVFDSNTQELKLENPVYDLKSRDALLKSADWLLHGTILSKIKPYLTFSIAANLKDIQNMANKQMQNYELYPGMNLNGRINKMSVNQVDLVPGALRVTANAQGDLRIDLKGF